MTKSLTMTTAAIALAALVIAAPASDAKRSPRYKVSVNYESRAVEVTDCKSTTDGKERIKDTTTTLTKTSETGYFPGGSRLSGYVETTIKTESTDPYVPSDEQKTRRELSAAYGPDQWEIETKGRYLIYDFEDASGDIDLIKIRAPSKGRSKTRTLTDTHNPKRESDERCDRSAESTVTETVIIKRIE